MKYRMQVNIRGRWHDVTPAGSNEPYEYTTRDEAEWALRTFYPGEQFKGGARVAEVEERAP